ncbi:hypothetical protein AAHS21_25245 [Mycobacterium sp. 050272]|uniref:hypothetical protein n=1 Tax=Mycobacterium sp. 050272 TaxID=3142488 RepID=UPI003193A73F
MGDGGARRVVANGFVTHRGRRGENKVFVAVDVYCDGGRVAGQSFAAQGCATLWIE